MDTKLAVIISSCDAYSDAWQPFFTLFFRYWTDFPYQLYLVTESKQYDDERVKTLTISDTSWATRLKEALRIVPQSYILYMQEDYFLTKTVNTQQIQELFSILEHEQAGSMRIYPDPPPNQPFKGYREVGIVKPGTPYRLSLQATLWNKEILQKLLVPGDNPWNTEHEGSKRSNELPHVFLSVKRNPFWKKTVSPVFEYICTGISKRLWTWDAIYLFQREAISADFSHRGTEMYATYLRRKLRHIPYIGGLFYFLYRVEYKLKTITNNLLN